MSALTEVILFVGGPADGQRIAIDAGKDSWEVAERCDLGPRLEDKRPAQRKWRSQSLATADSRHRAGM